jgi:hypothetical protein
VEAISARALASALKSLKKSAEFAFAKYTSPFALSNRRASLMQPPPILLSLWRTNEVCVSLAMAVAMFPHIGVFDFVQR